VAAEQNVYFYSTWATSPDWGPAAGACTVSGTILDDALDLYDTARSVTICGLGGDDSLEGGSANDTLLGGPGSDYLNGGAGTNVLRGGPGNDEIDSTEGNDRLFGDAGNDRIYARDGRPDVIDGGAGRDYAEIDGKDKVKRMERVSAPRRKGA
jgi:Ca2+-binding RTX toxin-like protein